MEKYKFSLVITKCSKKITYVGKLDFLIILLKVRFSSWNKCLNEVRKGAQGKEVKRQRQGHCVSIDWLALFSIMICERYVL